MIIPTLTALRTIRLLVVCLAISMGSISTARGQENVYFPYFELINLELDVGLQYSTSRLIKAYIEDHHDYNIILPKNHNEYYEKEDFAETVQYAGEYEADLILTGAIVELGDKYVISLGLQRLPSGEQIWHDMLKGNVREDLDPLLSRLGRNFNSPVKARNDAEFDEVTNYESELAESVHTDIYHYFGVMLGGTYVMNEQTVSGFGLGYTFDAPNLMITGNLEFYPTSSVLEDEDTGNKRYKHGNINIGAIYAFSGKGLSPFVQGGMDYGFHTIDRSEPNVKKTNGGVGFFLGGGFILNRNSAVNLRLNAALTLPLYYLEDRQLMGLRFGLVTSFSPGRRR